MLSRTKNLNHTFQHFWKRQIISHKTQKLKTKRYQYQAKSSKKLSIDFKSLNLRTLSSIEWLINSRMPPDVISVILKSHISGRKTRAIFRSKEGRTKTLPMKNLSKIYRIFCESIRRLRLRMSHSKRDLKLKNKSLMR